MNLCVFTGHMANDPELKYTPNGTPVCKFRLAVPKEYNVPEGEEDATFLDVVLWNQVAEFVANNGKKGRLIEVQSRYQTRNYQTEAGEKRRAHEFVAWSARFLDKKNGGYQPQDSEAPPARG